MYSNFWHIDFLITIEDHSTYMLEPSSSSESSSKLTCHKKRITEPLIPGKYMYYFQTCWIYKCMQLAVGLEVSENKHVLAWQEQLLILDSKTTLCSVLTCFSTTRKELFKLVEWSGESQPCLFGTRWEMKCFILCSNSEVNWAKASSEISSMILLYSTCQVSLQKNK